MNMHKHERAALSALARDDLLSFGTKCFGAVWPGQRFQPNWHHKAITYELTRLHKGENNRLIIAQPPRTLKSLFASAAWPSWTLGLDPTRQVMVITHTTSFAAELHRQFRRVVNSE